MNYEDIIANESTNIVAGEPALSTLSTPTIPKHRQNSMRTDISRAISGEEVMNRLRPKLKEYTSLGEPALRLEASINEKISYLRANLHPSTVEHLELVDWMLDKPFPYDDCDPNDDSWVDEAEAVGYSDIVPMEIIMHDREIWRNAR